MKAIVAFEIEVKMNHVFKLSQDRDKESYHNIIGEAQEQGGAAAVIAGEMEKRAKDQFLMSRIETVYCLFIFYHRDSEYTELHRGN
ncbi:MAG: hypothetical protein IPL53_25000 [Ignavibacteria bacterium]|nr:hypothetical protein [Ignavibacteria bacterium]